MQVSVGPNTEVKQGTTAVSEQLDEFGDVVDAPLDGIAYNNIYVLHKIPFEATQTLQHGHVTEKLQI